MKSLFLPLLALGLSACVAVVPQPQQGRPAVTLMTTSDNFTTRLNAIRRAQGVAPLGRSAILDRAARAHAADMQARGYFAHEAKGGPNGATPKARVKAAGCKTRTVAENIAKGPFTESIVLEGWANSPGHRQNLLSATKTTYGLGQAGDYWVMVLTGGC